MSDAKFVLEVRFACRTCALIEVARLSRHAMVRDLLLNEWDPETGATGVGVAALSSRQRTWTRTPEACPDHPLPDAQDREREELRARLDRLAHSLGFRDYEHLEEARDR